MTIAVTIEIDREDADHLEDFVNWATTEHFKAAIPSRDADKAWAVRQAANRISAAIQASFPKAPITTRGGTPMSRITTYTEAGAAHKVCHLTQPPHKGRCCASQCMAWQWGQAGHLTCSTKLLSRYAESAFEGYREDEEHEMPDFEVANFYQPMGEGWQFNTFSAGEDGWEAHWERDTDPERQGYCAPLPHPLAVLAKLDEISTAIYGRGGE